MTSHRKPPSFAPRCLTFRPAPAALFDRRLHSKNTTKLLLSYAFGNATQREWTLQLDLPLVAHRAGDRGGAPDATGFGDIQMRIGHVFDSEGVFRWALGVETQLNTAAQNQLGDGVFRLSPGLAFVLEPSNAFKFQTNI